MLVEEIKMLSPKPHRGEISFYTLLYFAPMGLWGQHFSAVVGIFSTNNTCESNAPNLKKNIFFMSNILIFNKIDNLLVVG